MRFEYRARDIKGQLHNGVIDASDRKAAVEALVLERYCVLGMRQVESRTNNLNPDLTALVWTKTKNQDLAVLTRQLTMMLAAGMPIAKCLQIASQQTNNKRLRETIGHIVADVESGWSLHESFSRHPQVFSSVYTSMLRAGEMGGILDGVLRNLSRYLESEEAFSGSIRNAAIYPLAILIVAIVTVIVLAVQVMPRLTGVLTSSGLELPAMTRCIMAATQMLQAWGWAMGLSVCGIGYITKRAGKTIKGRQLYDRIYTNIPILGGFVKQVAAARFAGALGLLLESGMPALPAFETAIEAAGNSAIAQILGEAMNAINEGETMQRALQNTGIFEPMVISMIALGEETGNLDKTLLYVAQHHEQILKSTLEKLTSIVEPALILLVAIIVGAFVVAILQPLLELMNLTGI
ncbi:MAG: type II secretion system F family protein [Syntrophomonadaceae bacterium]